MAEQRLIKPREAFEALEHAITDLMHVWDGNTTQTRREVDAAWPLAHRRYTQEKANNDTEVVV